MQQTQINFNTDKLTYFIGLDDLGWAWDLKTERDKKFRRDVLSLWRLIDKYSK